MAGAKTRNARYSPRGAKVRGPARPSAQLTHTRRDAATGGKGGTVALSAFIMRQSYRKTY
jgi:hypothetical protein